MASISPAKTLGEIADLSPRRIARMAGLFYLVFILTFAFASYVRSTIIVSGNAAATANNIVSSQGLFRLGFMSELISAVFFFLAAWALYVFLRPVNRNLALLFLLLNLGGVIVESSNMLNLLAPLTLLTGANYLNVFQPNQLQALAMSFLNSYSNGIMIAQIFYGAWVLPLGYLLYKSHLVPRILGILLIIDFFGILSWFFQFFFFPGYGILSYPGLAASFVAEVSLTLWLLIMGVKDLNPRLVGVSQ
jgi:Domain of unknown function (DUF4386)